MRWYVLRTQTHATSAAIHQIQYNEAQSRSRPPETNLLQTLLQFGDSLVRPRWTPSPNANRLELLDLMHR